MLKFLFNILEMIVGKKNHKLTLKLDFTWTKLIHHCSTKLNKIKINSNQWKWSYMLDNLPKKAKLLQIIFNLEKMFRENQDNVHDRQFMYQQEENVVYYQALKVKKTKFFWQFITNILPPELCISFPFLRFHTYYIIRKEISLR